jgi:hypothetical protein
MVCVLRGIAWHGSWKEKGEQMIGNETMREAPTCAIRR